MKFFGIAILKVVFYVEPGYWSIKCKWILITYQQLMYQHFLIVQQSFFPIDSFFCCLKHAKCNQKEKLHGNCCHILWDISLLLLKIDSHGFMMDSPFDKQLHQLNLTLYAQNRKFLLNCSKLHYRFKLAYPTICHK